VSVVHVDLIKRIREAIKRGQVDTVERLIGGDKTKLNVATAFGTWLHVAASSGQLDVLRRLVAMGGDVNAQGGIAGGGPLNEAANEGHVEVVKYLLSAGASLDVEKSERNPLSSAIQGGHLEVAKALIDAGIDTSISYNGPSMKGMDAVAFAREWGRGDILELLLASGCKDTMRSGRPVQPANDDDALMTWIREHLGEPDALSVQQVLPSGLPLKVHTIPWREGTRLAVTVGMSARAMSVPEGQERYRYAELVMVLPADWPIGPDSMKAPAYSWPYIWLRRVASWPHEVDTWLRPSIVIDCGEPLYAGCAMSALLIVADAHELDLARLKDGRSVIFYVAMPLYPEEQSLAKRDGAAVLVELLRESGFYPKVDVRRRNVGHVD
jgi:hypothetical protein